MKATNPQTSHHALQLLSEVARLFPEQAVKHAMTVFTFMGDSVVRQDSNHSFQVIDQVRLSSVVFCSLYWQTISAIVPVILQHPSMIAPLLTLFVNALPNIPAHRRERLFGHLITTMQSRFLPAVLLLLIQVAVFTSCLMV